MPNVKIKTFIAHYMIIKVAKDYLKYSYHLTFDHIKLLYFLVNEKNNEKYMDLNQLEMVEQKTKILQMLQYLYQQHWILKDRKDEDQRQLSISITELQKQKIHFLFSELLEMLNSNQLIINATTKHSIKYVITCNEMISYISQCLNKYNLSIEELYVLATLLINENEMTIKYMRYQTQRGVVALSPNIKKLKQKGYIIKERCVEDERTIKLKIKHSNMNLVVSIIESCYEILKKGIKDI
ncbi:MULTISPECIES: transcriptional regulator, SarA/Rot family [Staphylococcus]|uniref:transcriptional regulator, SarA/Rot family n=1 Tax=Staphylococcus TaxID=1279 RepID=UPI00119D96BF|nr:transcriptional regulator [Staphylococcus warneri]MCG7307364.1 transcriptional regulator [Staphylococcus warneri]